jgi:hypothetical protein
MLNFDASASSARGSLRFLVDLEGICTRGDDVLAFRAIIDCPLSCSSLVGVDKVSLSCSGLRSLGEVGESFTCSSTLLVKSGNLTFAP